MKKLDIPLVLIFILICFGMVRWIKLKQFKERKTVSEPAWEMPAAAPVLPRELILREGRQAPLRTLPELASEYRLELREGDMTGGSGSVLLYGPVRGVEGFVCRMGTPECGFSPEAVRFTPGDEGFLFCYLRFSPKTEPSPGSDRVSAQGAGTVPVLRKITDNPARKAAPEPVLPVPEKNRIGTVIREGGDRYAVIRTNDPGGFMLIREEGKRDEY
ncbi:MAG: hypothetical protein ACLFST_00645 [Spirochaetia bacterium]